MPESRKRKTKKGGGSSRATYSKKSAPRKKNFLIAAGIVGALVVVVIVFLVIRGGRSAGTEVTTASGLKYVDEVVGKGESPAPGKMCTVHYTGWLEDGTKFQSSLDANKPLEFRIGTGSVIKGWDEGIMTMKVGGKRKLMIPSDLGYGPPGSPPLIPPDANLVFDVELLAVKGTQGMKGGGR